jgi:hypothetical protein
MSSENYPGVLIVHKTVAIEVIIDIVWARLFCDRFKFISHAVGKERVVH